MTFGPALEISGPESVWASHGKGHADLRATNSGPVPFSRSSWWLASVHGEFPFSLQYYNDCWRELQEPCTFCTSDFGPLLDPKKRCLDVIVRFQRMNGFFVLRIGLWVVCRALYRPHVSCAPLTVACALSGPSILTIITFKNGRIM